MGTSIDVDIDRLIGDKIASPPAIIPLEVGGFLDGLDIHDAPEFSLWKDRQQARLLPWIKQALAVLIDECRRRGDHRQIEHLADRMLSLDELSEDAIRAKMEARAMAGDRLTALQIYEGWKERLAEELGASPSERVEGIAVRLRRRGWERSSAQIKPSVPTLHWRDRYFIGRGSEYRALYEAFESTRSGTPRHALVLGDSGVGKTTLVSRLTTAAALEGAAVARVQCYDLEREIPYATLGALVHTLLDRPGAAATAPESLSDLARIVPDVRLRFPSVPSAEHSQGETARIRLTEAVLQLLTSIADDQPVILVVDDLHLADEASLGALHLVLRRAINHPIMAVMISRPAELVHAPQAARLREPGDKLALEEIEVPPLTGEESRQLLDSLVTDSEPPPSSSVRRAMVRAANGFPMALELLAQDWQASGNQSLVLSLDAMTTEMGRNHGPSALFQQVLERASQALDPRTRNVLHLAAMLGRRLNDVHLYAIADLTVGETMAGMSQLTAARILRDNGHGLEFANELLRTAAYVGIPSPLRRVLHSSLSDWFIEEANKGIQGLGLEIAWHCLRAGRAAEASSYLLQGAQDAMIGGALDAAERALSTALPHLSASDRDRAALLLTEVLQEQGRWVESARTLLECRSCNDSQLATVLRIFADHRTHHLGPERACADVNTLIATADSTDDSALRIKAIRVASRLMPDVRDERLAREVLAALDRTVAIMGSGVDDGALELVRAQVLYHAGLHQASLQQLTACAKRHAERGTMNTAVGEVHVGLGAIGCYEGRYEAASGHFQGAYAIFARIGNEAAQTSTAAQIALCCGRLGDYRGQVRWSRIGSATTVASAYNLLQFAYYEAFALAMLGDAKGAVDRMGVLESQAECFSSPWLIQAWRFAKADISQLCGHEAAALAFAVVATHHPTPLLHATSFAGAYARWLAMISATKGRVDAVTREIDTLRDQLHLYDALDQVEILCACEIGRDTSVPAPDRSGLTVRLSKLPPSVVDQLRRLGMARAIS